MAILNTLRGIVESDPMRVPAPASMATGREDSFARKLEDATAPRDERLVADPKPVVDVDDEIAAVTPAPEPDAERKATTERAEVDNADEGAAFVRAPHQGHRPGSDDQNITLRRGERGRQATAGKGPSSPGASFTPVAGESFLNEFAERSARDPQLQGPAIVGTAGATTGSGNSAGEPLIRAIDGAKERGNLTPRAEAPKPGYRTSAATSAQLLDQARESIFKQIMLKITPDGGEMRLRLDPPELGELDLRMVVERGNRMSLTIKTERPDLADLIQEHIDELAQSLADIGLELAHTDVQARGAGEGRDAEQQIEDEGDEDAADDFQRPKSGGYIRADGLDFWV